MTSDATSTEQRMMTLWSEFIAAGNPIGPADNFFSLGGDSLTMTMLLFRINEEFGIDLPPHVLQESADLRTLCVRLDHARSRSAL